MPEQYRAQIGALLRDGLVQAARQHEADLAQLGSLVDVGIACELEAVLSRGPLGLLGRVEGRVFGVAAMTSERGPRNLANEAHAKKS